MQFWSCEVYIYKNTSSLLEIIKCQSKALSKINKSHIEAYCLNAEKESFKSDKNSLQLLFLVKQDLLKIPLWRTMRMTFCKKKKKKTVF